jgi:chemotaxis protein methyltransferase CheR
MASLKPEEIHTIFDYIEELCGIALDETKSYLIDARLDPLVQQFYLQSPLELVNQAKRSGGDSIRRAIVEAITTRETSFFRDASPFEALKFKVLPELIDQKMRIRSNRLRIWSAAASTGQEACSIGMVLHDMIPDIDRWDVQILGTDISEVALAKARSGVYSSLEVERGLSGSTRERYLSSHPDGYQVQTSILKLIRYQHLNLLEPFRFPTPFDIIFCRNVAIYFDKDVKIQLFRRLLPLLSEYGYLFVGASESLFDCGPEFQPQAHCRSTFYQPNLQRRVSAS